MMSRLSLPRALTFLMVASLVAGGVARGQSPAGVEQVIIPADAPPTSSSPANASGNGAVSGTSTAVAPAEKSEADKELDRLRKERDLIAAQNALAQEQLRQQLAGLEAEKQRLVLENSLRRERLDAEVAELRTQLDRMQLEIDLVNRQGSLDSAKRRDQLERELATLRGEEERLKLANSVAAQRLEAKLAELRYQDTEIKLRRAQLEMDVAQLQTDLSVREKQEVLRDLAPADQKYTLEPLHDGVLEISDRRIALNGVIAPYLADEVSARIDYFNNQNPEYPIFLVIDSSPGGSVMAGSKIIKAMQGSSAPVYVVVKSYAASMAAVITAMGTRSYAYPNAVILHHQISWIGFGNLTQQKEQLALSEQWWRRLATPVAQRMELTLDQFIARMYEQNSDGNWREFADTAKQLKWIDDIVHTVRETSLDKNPDRFGSRVGLALQLEEKVDPEGNPYALLPRLAPMDCYFVYNPDRYYRLR
jgi:ATP-dependent Clp protease protease subunit